MIDFYLVSSSYRVLLQCVALAGLASQAMLCVLYLYRPRWAERQIAGWLFLEVTVLLFTGLVAYLLAAVEYNAERGAVVPLAAQSAFYLFFALFLSAGGAVFYKNRRPINFLPALAALMVLPLWGEQSLYVLQYTGAVVLLFLRSVYCTHCRGRELQNKLSSLSVKGAVDSLPTGILFYEPGGYIVLLNRTMQELVEQIMGGPVQSGTVFYQALQRGEVLRGEQKYALDTAIVYELPNSSVWRFKCDDIFIRKKVYQQITAADITREWQLTMALEEKKKSLDGQREALLQMLENLEQESYEEEIFKRKNRVHDVIGERIAVVKNLLRSERPDIGAVAERIGSMKKELHQDIEPASVSFEQLAQSLRSVGINLVLQGALPGGETGRLIMELIRECTSNAVRHGLADTVEVSCRAERDGYILGVSNNGVVSDNVRESGGLRELRRRIEAGGGRLGIAAEPVFTITAWIGRE